MYVQVPIACALHVYVHYTTTTIAHYLCIYTVQLIKRKKRRKVFYFNNARAGRLVCLCVCDGEEGKSEE